MKYFSLIISFSILSTTILMLLAYVSQIHSTAKIDVVKGESYLLSELIYEGFLKDGVKVESIYKAVNKSGFKYPAIIEVVYGNSSIKVELNSPNPISEFIDLKLPFYLGGKLGELKLKVFLEE